MEDKKASIETKKPSETITDPNKERALRILYSTAREIQNLLQGHEIKPEEAILKVDNLHLDIESARPQFGSFSFWGGLVGKHTFPELQTQKKYIPVIKNLKLPDKVRKKGLGSAIVKTWEKSMENAGFDNLVVTNLSSPKAIVFWQNLSYKIPEAEKHKKTPYYMYKNLN